MQSPKRRPRTRLPILSVKLLTDSKFKSWLVSKQFTSGIDWCTGQGKFSYVFRAKRVSDNVLVALKLIKVSNFDD